MGKRALDRREFMKLATAAASLGTAAASAQPWSRPDGAGRPPRQAILILGESVRYDMLNCNVKTGLITPNLDVLAAGGVRFARAYNCQPVCGPSRSAILTGTFPHENGVWGNSMPLGETTHTIGQRLNDKKVHCAYVGKWHLDGFDYFGTGQAAPGWDEQYWYDMRNYLEELSAEDRTRSRAPETSDDKSWTEEMCFAYRVTLRALRFLEEHKDDDFLLIVAFDEPHGPSLAPEKYGKLYENYRFPAGHNLDDALADKPAEQRLWADSHPDPLLRSPADHRFFGSHTLVDAQIGRLQAAREQFAPGAMVLFTSDHGVFLGAHRLSDKGPAMYDEITRIPLIVNWPGHAPANAVVDKPVSQIDLCATLMDFFAFEKPATVSGESLLSTFRQPGSARERDVFIEYGRYEVDHDGFGGFQPIRCICDGRFKLSIHLLASDELYDLETDPDEMNNLIGSEAHKDIRDKLHDRLLNWMDLSRDPFRGDYWGARNWRPEFAIRWKGSGMTRQRESDGYLPRELDYDTGLPMTAATRPK
jgi:uncharacterized sulfatase